MTPEAQKIAIAEACGLKTVRPWIIKNVVEKGDDRTVGIWSDTGWVPDYLNDLNAMQSAFNMLTPQQKRTCYGHIGQLQNLGENILSVTPGQWAKAFLKTLGLWTD